MQIIILEKNVEKRSNPLREETSVSDVILMIIICTPIILFIFVIIYAIFAIEEVRTVCEGVLLYINEFPGIMITTYITLVTFLGIFIKGMYLNMQYVKKVFGINI